MDIDERTPILLAPVKENWDIYHAVEVGDLERIEALIEAGAEAGERSLSLAVSSGNLEITKYLIEQGNVSMEGNEWDDNANYLFNAVGYKHNEIARYLIGKGSAVDERVLVIAASANIDLVPYLLEHASSNVSPDIIAVAKCLIGIDAEITSGRYSSLIMAIEKGRLDLVRELVSKGANCHDGYEVETLLTAIQSKSLSLVKYLVEEQSLRVARDHVYIAANLGLQDIMVYLMPLIDNTDKCSQSMLYAAQSNQLKIVQYLRAHTKPEDLNDALKVATMNNAMEVTTYLVEQGADISVIHDAMVKDHPVMKDYFISLGLELEGCTDYNSHQRTSGIYDLILKCEVPNPSVIKKEEHINLHRKIWKQRNNTFSNLAQRR